MSNSHQFGSWSRPRPRGELRFFADLEEQNNRSDYLFQRRQGNHFKPYEQRPDRYGYSKHQRDYGIGRNRYSSESGHKYTGSGRNDHVIDPVRRQQSDEPIPSRFATSSVKLMSRTGRSVSVAVDDQKRGHSPFHGGDDENAGHETYQQSADNDSGHAKRMRDHNSQVNVRAKSRETSEDFLSGRTSAGCRIRRDSGEASGGSHRPGSESSASCSTFCPYGETRAHNEGNIDLVHITKLEDEVDPAAPPAAISYSGDTHLNRYDAASISTITSAELSSQREDTDMSISEGDDSCSDDEDSRSGRGSRAESRNASSQTSGWNNQTRAYGGQWRSESNSDSVFNEPSTGRKYPGRGYQVHCDRRNGYSDIRSERSRSFSRSSPPGPLRRQNYHISTRLYDFDDYGVPDRDERINRTLYLGALDPHMSEQQIRNLFEPYGEIKSVFVKKVDPSRNTTYGFVKMGNLLQAFRARAALNGHRLGYLKLVIRYGKTYPTSRVWLGNLSPDTDSTLLYHELDRFGAVVKMVHFRASGEALVEFESIPGAVEAKNGMRGVILSSAGITRSSSLSSTSSSRPASSSTSTPSPPPPHPANSIPSSAHPLHLDSVPTPTPAATTASSSAIGRRFKGIVTDFDDHESNGLLDSASNNNRVQSTFFDNPVPPDSSFASNQPFPSRTLSSKSWNVNLSSYLPFLVL